MKLSIYCLFASLAHGAVLSKRAPQSPGRMPPAEKPLSIESIKPRIRTTAQRQFIRYGPLQLPASKDTGAAPSHHDMGAMGASSASKGGGAMDPNGTPFNKFLSGGLCSDCTVLAAKLDIVFENGTRADIVNGVYLHHVVAGLMGNSTGKPKSTWVNECPTPKTGPGSAPAAGPQLDVGFVGGAVDEFTDYFTSPDGKVDSGYFIPANNMLFLSGEVIIYLSSPQNVYIRLDLEWIPGKHGVDTIKSPLNVEGCDFTHAAFKNAAADKGVIKSEDFTVSRDVTVIVQRAHMHDGGDSVTAFLNGKKICTSQATYGSAGAQAVVNGTKWTTISKMSECLQPLELKKGDKIRLEAAYDNVAHPLRISHGEAQGNMAFMTFTVVPKSA